MNAAAWLALQALTLWPHAVWAGRRVADGSDDPLGPLALLALVGLLVRSRRRLAATPRPAFLVAAVALALGGAILARITSPLPAALLGVMGFAAAVAGWLPRRHARLPLFGLAVLSLPLLASLQFYVGYPLRVVAATAAGAMLRIVGIDAQRAGATLAVDGHLVLVDAPCSGVQMAWLAYFLVFVAAELGGLSDRALLRRLPFVGALVLLANALRNAVLVGLAARPQGLSNVLHEGIGLVVLAVLGVALLWLLSQGDRHERRA